MQKQSIREIWNGKQFTELRNQFQNNLPDKRCSHCYNIEKSGKQSLRQISNQNYFNEITRIELNNPEPIYWDIRFSNICNFKCITCWHGNSSAWYEESSKRNASNNRIIKAFTNSFDELLGYLNNVQEIYFAGGEPLIMDEHYQILEVLEKRKLFNIKLRYNTNFSSLHFKDKHILEIWERFSNVQVSASVDAPFEAGEKIREGFSWDQFLTNRKEMIKITPKTYFEIAPTVSSLNIKHLPKLHQHLVNQNLLAVNNIYLNLLERPLGFNVQQLSPEEKNEITDLLNRHIDWLNDHQASTPIIADFKNIITYMKG